MKKNLSKIKWCLLLFTFLQCISCSNSNQEKGHDMNNMDDMKGMDMPNNDNHKRVFTCPMHPEIIRSKAGNCPICGMSLVEKLDENRTAPVVDLDLDDIIKPVDEYVLSSLKLINPIEKSMSFTTQVNGYISYNTDDFSSISSRIEGRIEKLYVNYNYQKVEKGQKLYEIYSPELQTAQQNLLFLLKNDSENQVLIQGAKQKLSLLGLSKNQIDALVLSNKIIYTTTIYSPVSGYIIEESLALNMNKSNSMSSGNNQDKPSTKELSVKEGQYLNKGESIFKVVNYSNVWAFLKLIESDKRDVKKGDKIILNKKGTAIQIESKIDFIEPIFQGAEKFLTVHVHLNNSKGNFKIGDLITGKILKGMKSGLWVNQESIVDLGHEKIVLIQTKSDLLKVRKIKTGVSIDNWVQVIEGLSREDLIAENSQFLIDSESFIKQ
ncbi:MAG: efflux RND transporter periplasmic adaptor subunit [Crocinitomicaceae bacterium]